MYIILPAGRGFDRQPFNRANFQYGRAFHPRGAGRGGRVGSLCEHEFNVPQRPVHGRQNSGRGLVSFLVTDTFFNV